jgi:hypothetical protein
MTDLQTFGYHPNRGFASGGQSSQREQQKILLRLKACGSRALIGFL